MVRTQIYLSESQKQALERLSAERGLSIAELIRTAIDCWLKEACSTGFEETLEKTFGLWRDREDRKSLAQGMAGPRGKMESSNTFNGAFAISASPR